MKRTVQTTSQTREPVGPALVAMATAMQALAAKKLAELAQRLEPQKPPSMLERLGDKRKTLLAAATGVGGAVYLGKSGRARPVIQQAKSRLPSSRSQQQTEPEIVIAADDTRTSDPLSASVPSTIPPRPPERPI
jgi:hypothetical protein